MEKYKNDIFRAVFGILRDEKAAEDATQEAFIKIYYSLPNYENRGFKTWITRIAVNHAIDMRRKQVHQHELLVESLADGTSATNMESVERQLINKQQRQVIYKKLAELPDNYRHVVYGFYIEDKSYEELAREHNVKIKTIEMRLYRARHWMRKHWKEDDFL